MFRSALVKLNPWILHLTEPFNIIKLRFLYDFMPLRTGLLIPNQQLRVPQNIQNGNKTWSYSVSLDIKRFCHLTRTEADLISFKLHGGTLAGVWTVAFKMKLSLERYYTMKSLYSESQFCRSNVKLLTARFGIFSVSGSLAIKSRHYLREVLWGSAH